MLVETFECHETASEPIEAAEEAVALIESLGLNGQRELLSRRDDHNTRCPYREMTADEKFVYGTLCPTRAKLKDYKRTPIPLRVLQVAAHANSLGIFKELMVLDAGTAVEKDPVLVGVIPDKQYSWMTTDFILARWGDELEAFVVLLKRAAAKVRESWRADLVNIRANVDAALANIDSFGDVQIAKAGAGSQYTLSSPT